MAGQHYREQLYAPAENFRELVNARFPTLKALAEAAGIKYETFKRIQSRDSTRASTAQQIAVAYAAVAGIEPAEAYALLWVAKPRQPIEPAKHRPHTIRGGRPRKTTT